MAGKKLKEEDLVLNIIVNGNKAQSDIGKLARTIQDAKSKVSALEAEQHRLEKQGKQNSARYKELTVEIDRYNAVITESKKRITELEQSLRLEDQSIQQLQKSLRKLTTLRNQSFPGTAQYKAYQEQIDAVRGRLDQLTKQSQHTGNVLTRMGSSVKNFFSSMFGGIAIMTSVAMGIRKATDEFTSFDDKIADVMKTTNGTKEEVLALNKELEKLQTRTSQDDLLGLGRIGGKLGITDMDELRGFVESSNQIIVALNEDLGGNVEETVRAVGKIADIFGVTDTYGMEQGLLKVGSAINELGMASTANEKYMVEFSRRMAGVAPLANISVDQVLGLAATLDQFGQTAEVSSTALSKLFLKIAKESDKYAKYARMEVGAFKELLETDFMAAFTKVLEGVKGSSEGINELAGTLGDLGLDGGRVIGVIGTLANNTETLQKQMDLANKSFEEGTSLTDEYNIKNSTAAAQLEMARKEVTRFWRELGQKLWPVIIEGNKLWASFLQMLIIIISFIGKYIKVIGPLTVAIITYYTAVQLAAKWEAITTGYMVAKRVAMISLSGVYALLTGNLMRATAALRMLNITMAANPAGIAALAIAGLTAWVMNMGNRLDAAAKAQKAVTEEMQRAKDASDALKVSTDSLVSSINDTNNTRHEQAKAFYDLKKLYPKLLSNMSLEEFQAKASADALRELKEARSIEEGQTLRSNHEQAIQEVEELTKKVQSYKAIVNTPEGAGIVSRYKEANEQLEIARERAKRYWDQLEEIRKIEFEAKPVQEKLKNYRDIETKLAAQVKQFKEQRQLTEDINRGWNDFGNTMSKISLSGLISQLEDVQAKIASLNGEEDKAIESGNTVGVRRAALKDEIKLLEELYETLNATDMAGQRKNLSQRQALQKQLDLLDGKQISAWEKTAKSAEDKLKKHQEQIERQIADWEKAAEKSDPLSDSKLVEIEAQYQKLINLTDLSEEERLRITTAYETQIQNRREEIMAEGVKKYRARQLAELAVEQEEKRLAWDEEYNMRLEAINNMDGLESEKELARSALREENRQKQMLHEQETLNARWMLLTQFQLLGDMEIEEAERVAREKREIERRSAEITRTEAEREAKARIELEKKTQEALIQIKIEQAKAFEAFFGILHDFASENSKLAILFLLLEKSAAAASVLLNLQKEIAAYYASAALQGVLVPPLAGAFKALAAKQATAAKIRAGVSLGVIAGTTISNIAKSGKSSTSSSSATTSSGPTRMGTVPGREEGGFLVNRAQDGKKFNATYDPDARGYVHRPTVITGESGSEFVASSQAVENPSVRPFLDIIDIAQRNGSISTLNLEKIMSESTTGRARLTGRQSGGYLSHDASSSTVDANISARLDEISGVMVKAEKTMDRLEKTIAKGIKAEVALLGKNGFYEKDNEYKNIQRNANL